MNKEKDNPKQEAPTEPSKVNPNMRFYDQLRTPPATALKAITGGRLKGMTDINPQWRLEAMTSVFGPVGVGWKFEIVKLWTEPGPNGQVFCFAQVNVFFEYEKDRWSDPVPGLGGDMMIEEEGFDDKKHLHANDECYKMAITDALGTAMKVIGVAAEVYAGHMFPTKYSRGTQEPQPAPANRSAALRPASQVPPPATKEARKTPTDAEQKKKGFIIGGQVKYLGELLAKQGIEKEPFKVWLKAYSGTDNPWTLFADRFDAVVKAIMETPGVVGGLPPEVPPDDGIPRDANGEPAF
jgi:hypothetical protein